MTLEFFCATDVVEDPESVLIWRGLATPSFGPRALARARLDIFARRGERWIRAVSNHEQRHHPEPVLGQAIEAAQLRKVAVYGQDPAVNFEAPVDELRHSKAIYLASLDTQHRRRR